MSVRNMNTADAEKVVAIADWEAEDEWQLTFYTDEIIIVLDKYEGNPEYEGWWQGQISGPGIEPETGLFPVSYTKPHTKKVFKQDDKAVSSMIKKLQEQCGFLGGGKKSDVDSLQEEFEALQSSLASPGSAPAATVTPAKVAVSTPSFSPAVEAALPTGDAAQRELVSLKAELDDLKRKLARETEAHGNTKKSLANEQKLSKEAGDREADLSSKLAELTTVSGSLEPLQKELAMCKQKLQQQNGQLQKMNQSNKQLQGQLAEKDEQYNALHADTEQKIYQLQNENEDLAWRLEKVKQEKKEAQPEAAAVDGDLLAQVDKKRAKAKELKKALTDSNNKVTQLQNQLKANQALLQKTRQELQEKMAAEPQSSANDEELNQLKITHDANLRALGNCRQTIQELQKQKAQQVQQCRAHMQQIQNLTAHLQTSSHENEDLEAAYNEQQQTVQQLQLELEGARELVDRCNELQKALEAEKAKKEEDSEKDELIQELQKKLVNESRSKKQLITMLTQARENQAAAEAGANAKPQKKGMFGGKGSKAPAKAPPGAPASRSVPPPKPAKVTKADKPKVQELEEQIASYTKMVEKIMTERDSLVNMNRMLMQQIKELPPLKKRVAELEQSQEKSEEEISSLKKQLENSVSSSSSPRSHYEEFPTSLSPRGANPAGAFATAPTPATRAGSGLTLQGGRPAAGGNGTVPAGRAASGTPRQTNTLGTAPPAAGGGTAPQPRQPMTQRSVTTGERAPMSSSNPQLGTRGTNPPAAPQTTAQGRPLSTGPNPQPPPGGQNPPGPGAGRATGRGMPLGRGRGGGPVEGI